MLLSNIWLFYRLYKLSRGCCCQLLLGPFCHRNRTAVNRWWRCAFKKVRNNSDTMIPGETLFSLVVWYNDGDVYFNYTSQTEICSVSSGFRFSRSTAIVVYYIFLWCYVKYPTKLLRSMPNRNDLKNDDKLFSSYG